MMAWLAGWLRLFRFGNLLMVAICQVMVWLFLLTSFPPAWFHLKEWPLLLTLTATLLAAAGGYTINDYYDQKIDLLNKPAKVVVGKLLSRRGAMLTHALLSLLAILAAAFTNKQVFFTVVGSVALLWLYSVWLKRTPLMGNLAVAFLSGLSVFIPALIYTEHQKKVFVFAVFAFLMSLVREVVKDMEDWHGDQKEGCRTLPIAVGFVKTKWFLHSVNLVFILAMFSLGLAWKEQFFWLLSGLLVWVAWFSWKLHLADTKASFTMLSLWCKVVMLMGIASIAWVAY
jgi:4-hydroxybenzoate polyprenyltransferase